MFHEMFHRNGCASSLSLSFSSLSRRRETFLNFFANAWEFIRNWKNHQLERYRLRYRRCRPNFARLSIIHRNRPLMVWYLMFSRAFNNRITRNDWSFLVSEWVLVCNIHERLATRNKHSFDYRSLIGSFNVLLNIGLILKRTQVYCSYLNSCRGHVVEGVHELTPKS